MNQQPVKRQRSFEIAFVVMFVTINLLVPLLYGELYPFSTSPMFCDEPTEYCVYELSVDDEAIDLEPYGLHLVYDGNPPGLGMGIKPQPTMHEFGAVPSKEEVNEHLSSVLNRHPELEGRFDIKQHITRAGKDHRLEKETVEWTFDVEAQSK